MLKKILAALMLYSKVYIPCRGLNKEDFEGAITYLPIVGIIIGALQYILFLIAKIFRLPVFVTTLGYILVPLIVTGGFHVDGFMDTEDALKSYRSREEKLSILKDPHIGAFSIISLLIYVLIEAASVYTVLYFAQKNIELAGNVVYISYGMLLLIPTDFIVRAIAVILSIKLKKAKESGMLNSEISNTDRMVIVLNIGFIIAGYSLLVYINWIAAAGIILIMLIYILLYRNKMYREFGGVSGDIIGYYICKARLLFIVVIAFYVLINCSIQIL